VACSSLPDSANIFGQTKKEPTYPRGPFFFLVFSLRVGGGGLPRLFLRAARLAGKELCFFFFWKKLKKSPPKLDQVKSLGPGRVVVVFFFAHFVDTEKRQTTAGRGLLASAVRVIGVGFSVFRLSQLLGQSRSLLGWGAVEAGVFSRRLHVAEAQPVHRNPVWEPGRSRRQSSGSPPQWFGSSPQSIRRPKRLSAGRKQLREGIQ